MWINIFFNYFFIMVLSICLWIPQIVFNINKNNRYGYPFIYIIGSTIDKLIYPIYFRGFKGNFIGCKVNENLISLMVLFVLFTIVILYIQIFSNPRFMCPKSYYKNEFNFYKTKQELISIKSDIGLEECVICLSPIFEIEPNPNNKMIEMEDKSNKNISKEDEEKLDVLDNIKNNPKEEKEKLDALDYSTNNLTLSTNNSLDEEGEEKDKIINNNNNNIIIKDNAQSGNNNIIKQIWKIIKILFTDNFFSFYKKGSDSNGELYMYTPCSHVFHTECLEKWFEFKKECPNCRISMKEYLE